MDESRGDTRALLTVLPSFQNRPALCRQAWCLGSCLLEIMDSQMEEIQVFLAPLGGDLMIARHK